MIWNEVIKGKYIDLRAVTKDDAKFIIDLRNDELKINIFIQRQMM